METLLEDNNIWLGGREETANVAGGACVLGRGGGGTLVPKFVQYAYKLRTSYVEAGDRVKVPSSCRNCEGYMPLRAEPMRFVRLRSRLLLVDKCLFYTNRVYGQLSVGVYILCA
jgi:hypothetical protein